jgi:hypothetical protein
MSDAEIAAERKKWCGSNFIAQQTFDVCVKMFKPWILAYYYEKNRAERYKKIIDRVSDLVYPNPFHSDLAIPMHRLEAALKPIHPDPKQEE